MNNLITAVFTGGGTGGHIYPGLAAAAEFRSLCKKNNIPVKIFWFGNSLGMDKVIIEKSINADIKMIDAFFGIPSGKLRRYFSIKNFFDLFKITAGFIVSFFVLLKLKPALLFSKGGFVSVPPCIAASILRIPVFTHECDFTPGLATKINSFFAKNILVSYSETAVFFNSLQKQKIIHSGNPVRQEFYSASPEEGRKFLNISENNKKLILLVVGGSSGASQLNKLIEDNIEWLCKNFIVIHQTGISNSANDKGDKEFLENYKIFPFIYSQMPHVIACADIVISRAGANSLCECAVLGKPLILIPLCGQGTRGDQEDNAEYFEKAGAAVVLKRENVSSEKLKEALVLFSSKDVRDKYCAACKSLMKIEDNITPSKKIAQLLFKEICV